MEGFQSRLAINVPVLVKILELRRRITSLLGYKTWYGSLLAFLSKLGTNESFKGGLQNGSKDD